MELFSELSVIIAVAAGIAVIMHLLRQPLIVGHIVTGLIVGPFALNIVQSTETLALLGHIGVAILLFTVGLHLSPAIVKAFGRVAVLTGVGQVIFTTLAGYAVCVMLGFSPLTSLYLAVALSFSSTIIILKLITDRGDIDILYAKIAIGFLLIQDLIAVILLLGIPLLAVETTPGTLIQFGASTALLAAILLLGASVLTGRIAAFFERSQELLFLLAITWGIGIAALFKIFGFSIESGALVAGIALASLPARREIISRLTPLRDFFLVLFFIYLGAQLHLGELGAFLPSALILSALVLIGNPLILMAITGILGYRKKTSLQVGLTVAQISEFSLILVGLGVSLGHVDSSILSLATLVGIITIFISSYLVRYSDTIYEWVAPWLSVFERDQTHEPRMRKHAFDVVLFGCNRIGFDFLAALKELNKKLLVVDYDPGIVASLRERRIPVEYGDAGDVTFLEGIDFSKTSLVISTIPDQNVNTLLKRVVSASNSDAVVIVVAHRVGEALSHYDDGVDYVVLPHFLGGQHAAELVLRLQDDKDRYARVRHKHRADLELRLAIGHEHPHPRLL